jgi:hypothetical protein
MMMEGRRPECSGTAGRPGSSKQPSARRPGRPDQRVRAGGMRAGRPATTLRASDQARMMKPSRHSSLHLCHEQL